MSLVSISLTVRREPNYACSNENSRPRTISRPASISLETPNKLMGSLTSRLTGSRISYPMGYATIYLSFVRARRVDHTVFVSSRRWDSQVSVEASTVHFDQEVPVTRGHPINTIILGPVAHVSH